MDSDENATAFLRWPAHKALETTEAILKEWISNYQNPAFYQWAIVQKDGRDEQIGTIAVADKNDHLNIVHIGYCTGSRWWHQGITSEAFSAIIPFLFGRVKANRIEAQFDPNNPNSGKVMVKCGLTYEGTLRQADLNNKGIVDAAMYSLLASLSIAPDNLFLLLSDCQYIPKRAKQAPDCEVISSVFSGLPPLWSHSIFGESLGEVLL